MKSIKDIEKIWLDEEYPVWWETYDNRPAGEHKAKVIEVIKYTGRYDFIACVFKLMAPDTHRGWLEMTIGWIRLEQETRSLLENSK